MKYAVVINDKQHELREASRISDWLHARCPFCQGNSFKVGLKAPKYQCGGFCRKKGSYDRLKINIGANNA